VERRKYIPDSIGLHVENRWAFRQNMPRGFEKNPRETAGESPGIYIMDYLGSTPGNPAKMTENPPGWNSLVRTW
jgi:hypothetical protein